MNNYLYSYSSITLLDALKEDENLLENLVMETEEDTNEFINTFKAKYNLYDIAGETIPLFKLMIENRFNLKKKYYQDLLNEYNKEIDYLDGIVESETIEDNTTDSGESSSTSNTEDNDTIYDLPYKQTENMYATKKVNNIRDGEVNNTSTSTKNKNITREKKGNVNILEQKIKYLKYIRNIYEEFVNEFKDCFSLIYG